MWMQDQVGESFRLDWIESFEFGQEFEKVYFNWLTNIAPLWTLINNNLSFDTSFDYSSFYHCLLHQALPLLAAATTTTCFRILSADTFETFGPWIDYQTSQQMSSQMTSFIDIQGRWRYWNYNFHL